MKGWWLKLTPRERMLIAAAGALVGALAAMQLVLAPLLSWREHVAQSVRSAEQDYRLVYRAAALGKPAAPRGEGEPARALVTDLAGRAGVSLTFVNALADGGVDIQAGPAAPENVFAFLSALETQHGVKVVAADISRTADDPGKVQLQATLSR